jgi:hypothetical protein
MEPKSKGVENCSGVHPDFCGTEDADAEKALLEELAADGIASSPSTNTNRGLVTSARVKSYQLLKVVSRSRAPGKRSSLASSQLLVIERFHFFGAVRLQTWFLKRPFLNVIR